MTAIPIVWTVMVNYFIQERLEREVAQIKEENSQKNCFSQDSKNHTELGYFNTC